MAITRKHRVQFARGAALAASLVAVCGCQEEIHSAQWYMGHGSELQAKLAECKKYPSLNDSDQNCKNATEAFMTLVTVTAQKAQEAQEAQQQQAQPQPPAPQPESN